MSTRFNLYFLSLAILIILIFSSTLATAKDNIELSFSNQTDLKTISETISCQAMDIDNSDLVIIPDNYESCSFIISNLNIDSEKKTIFQIGARFNDLTNRGVKIYWTNEIGEEFKIEKSIYKDFDLKYLKNESPYQTVTFDLAENLEWQGIIREMKFEFHTLSQVFYIDFMEFKNAPLLTVCAPHKKWFGLEKRIFLILIPLFLIAILASFRIYRFYKPKSVAADRKGFDYYLLCLFTILSGLLFFINSNFPFDFFPYLKMNIFGFSILYPMILLFFLFLIHLIISPSSIINFDRTKIFYFIFMFCGFISIKNSVSVHDSMIRIVLYFIPAALLLITINPKFLKMEHIRLICAFIALSCFAVSLNGLIEAFFNRNLIFDDLYRAYAPIYIEYILGIPVSSSFVDPSVLGSFIVLCIPFCLHFMLFERKNKTYLIIGILSSVTSFICLIYTCSWGSLFAIIISMLFYFLQNNLRLFAIIMTGLIIIGFVSTLCLLPGYIKYVDRSNEIDKIIVAEKLSMHQIAERFKDDLDQTFFYSMNQRIEGGKMALVMCAQKPFFGIGLGNYDKFFKKNYGGKQMSLWIYTVPDNQFLRTLAENGIFGFIFFTAAFITLFIKLIKSIFAKDQEKSVNKLAFAFATSILGFTVNITAYDGLFWFSPNFCFWFVVALFLSFYSIIFSQTQKAKSSTSDTSDEDMFDEFCE
jgi:hypothetical protein